MIDRIIWIRYKGKLSPKKIVIFEVNEKVKDINAERALLIKEIQQVEDISLLQAIKAVLHYGLKNEGRISLEQYNRELEEAEARIERGEYVVHEEAVEIIKGWRKTDS